MSEVRLLHITATHLNPAGGVPVVLRELVQEQNRIEGFVARVLSLVAPVDQMNSEFFDILNGRSIAEYIDVYKPNIVILHSFYYLEYNRVVKVLLKKKIPYLIEPHGSFNKYGMRKSRVKKLVANHTIFRRQIKGAKAFVFLNEAEKNTSVYRKDLDLIIPNGYDSSKITWDKQSRATNKLYYIGRYDIKEKGINYFFDALEIIDKKEEKICVEFWGKGDKSSTKYIKDRISKFKNICVKENGPLYGTDQNIELEQLGPMILPSRHEGLPMTVLEALAYGNPCIVTPGTNMHVEISDGKLGWATELDPNSIAKTIIVAMREYDEHMSEYVSRCKQYISTKYSWSKIAKNSYEKMCELLRYGNTRR